MMDEVDGWLIVFGMAALSVAVWLIAVRLAALESDMELARIKTPARLTEGNDLCLIRSSS
jgi:hypothetical protein